MWLRSLRRRADEVRCTVLPGRDLFILFDLEIAFLFPWAVTLREIGPAGFWAMMILPGHPGRRLRLRVEKGRARLGVIPTDTDEAVAFTGGGNVGTHSMAIDGVLKEGFVTTSVDALINWSKTGSLWR